MLPLYEGNLHPLLICFIKRDCTTRLINQIRSWLKLYYWNRISEEDAALGLSNIWKNYYALQYTDSMDAAAYALKNWNRLNEETDALRMRCIPPLCQIMC